jgi:hypothetical protein
VFAFVRLRAKKATLAVCLAVAYSVIGDFGSERASKLSKSFFFLN